MQGQKRGGGGGGGGEAVSQTGRQRDRDRETRRQQLDFNVRSTVHGRSPQDRERERVKERKGGEREKG